MFIVYAVPIGLLAGFLVGGRLDGLAGLRFRWAWVALAGLAAQVVLFSGAVDEVIGSAGPALYVASTVAVLAAVLRNVRIRGLPLVAAGAVSNLAAILANGGYMPADPGAAAVAGLDAETGAITNSVILADPNLRPLTDIFAIPAGLPMANVFSVGDLLIGLGVASAIALAMRRETGADTAAGASPATPVRAGNSPD